MPLILMTLNINYFKFYFNLHKLSMNFDIIKRCNIFKMLIIYEIILDLLLIVHKLFINFSPCEFSSVSRDIIYIMQKPEFELQVLH
jgi:hypothetical protein